MIFFPNVVCLFGIKAILNVCLSECMYVAVNFSNYAKIYETYECSMANIKITQIFKLIIISFIIPYCIMIQLHKCIQNSKDYQLKS